MSIVQPVDYDPLENPEITLYFAVPAMRTEAHSIVSVFGSESYKVNRSNETKIGLLAAINLVDTLDDSIALWSSRVVLHPLTLYVISCINKLGQLIHIYIGDVDADNGNWSKEDCEGCESYILSSSIKNAVHSQLITRTGI